MLKVGETQKIKKTMVKVWSSSCDCGFVGSTNYNLVLSDTSLQSCRLVFKLSLRADIAVGGMVVFF